MREEVNKSLAGKKYTSSSQIMQFIFFKTMLIQIHTTIHKVALFKDLL